MKTRGLMLIAFLCSGTVFAQKATVKTEQTTSVTTTKGNATVKSDIAADHQDGTDANANSQSAITLEKDLSGTTSEVKGTASEVKGIADEHINTAIEAGKQSTVQVTQGIKNTLNTSAGIGGSLLKTTNLKIAPVRINSQIISRTGLFIR
ncbi:hypothetical protein AAHN97_22140 [Chitinophaga niabensis]|uniref:hypothetical protein n=1 Tax=Chitinophaga niabensis TaxID=536979 RepID=UPI0031BB790E